ncbi:hypothetical protein PLEOSDRAFT_1082633 [Pleurotus ostreatus PC15]|uniref:F-box domain-containing protein n=1 Tax=Pleurotus ostreatus (strain PC15) TaxID=1137138 RepID=A0A067NNK3_PLEO1|nr:hypothetical protein PLEOSDRAFT_1082633 [Pleurotus ostreatus PC15]
MLPPEILLAIVNELVSDRRTLLDLLFVSRQFHSLALQPLYHEIAFRMDRPDESLIKKLCSLARNAERNPGMRFTTSFSFVLKGHRAAPPNLFYEMEEAIKRIVPVLVAVRRICISMHASVNAQILWPLPVGAPLTHLRVHECSLKSEYLRRFLSSRPALQSLEIDCFAYGTWRMNLVPYKLPPGSFPPLRSLSVPLRELAYFETPPPSLINLDLSEPTYALERNPETLRQLIMPFTSIRALSFSNVLLFSVSLLPQLPNLEYLRLDETFVRCCPPCHISYAFGITQAKPMIHGLLTTTRLKYIRCLESEDLGHDLFGASGTLVVADIASRRDHTYRMCRGVDNSVPLNDHWDEWEGWWERAQRAVTNAERSSLSMSRV